MKRWGIQNNINHKWLCQTPHAPWSKAWYADMLVFDSEDAALMYLCGFPSAWRIECKAAELPPIGDPREGR